MENNPNKTILVTGGAGFLGSHLCEALLARGNKVVAIDNLFTGQLKNIEHLKSNPNFTFKELDIVEPFYFDEPISQIYNLACPASPIHYQANAIRTIKINTIGIINVLGLARRHSARILQTSTSEVYGDPLEHPQRESYRGNVNIIGSRACYDEGKRIAEALFFEYHRNHGVEIRVARIFNTYGPNMLENDGRVISNFIIQALRGENITVYGDGLQTRSFCYVSDMIAGLIALMNHHEVGPINLGNPEELTIFNTARKIIEMTSSASKIIFKPLPVDDPTKRKPDIALAEAKLGWSPKISFVEGLAETIKYFE